MPIHTFCSRVRTIAVNHQQSTQIVMKRVLAALTLVAVLVASTPISAVAWICSKKGANWLSNINDCYVGTSRCPATLSNSCTENTLGTWSGALLDPYYKPKYNGLGSLQACSPTTCLLRCSYTWWSQSRGQYVSGYCHTYSFPTGEMNFWTPGASSCTDVGNQDACP